MADRIVTATEFKAKCLELIDGLAAGSGEIVVTKRQASSPRVAAHAAAQIGLVERRGGGQGRFSIPTPST